jgi:hypothetical protein
MNTCFDDSELDVNSVTSLPEQEATNSTSYALTCPLCDEDLAGWSEEKRTTHVNACLNSSSDAVNPMSIQSGSELPVSISPSRKWACKTCIFLPLITSRYSTPFGVFRRPP